MDIKRKNVELKEIQIRLIPKEEMDGQYYHNHELWGKLERGGKNLVPKIELSGGISILDKDSKKRKRIDAIGKRGEVTYIIETKRKLNYQAIGQVFIYEYLYQKHHREETIKKGILCEDITDHVLLCFCSKNDITVFKPMKDDIIEEYKPNTVKPC